MDAQHVGRGALDLDHVDDLAGLDAVVLVVRARRSTPRRRSSPGPACRRPSSRSTMARLPISASAPVRSVGPLVQALDDAGPDQRRAARPRRPARARSAGPAGRREPRSAAPTSAPTGEHDQEEVEADQLESARARRPARASQPTGCRSASPWREPIHSVSNRSGVPTRHPAGRVATVLLVQRQAHPEGRGQLFGVASRRQRARRDDPSGAQQQGVGEARRDLLDVVATPGSWPVSTSSMASDREGRDEVLAAAEVEPGRRLVEEQQLRVGHQRARDLHPLALALAERAEGPVEEVPDARPRGAAAVARSWSSSSYSSRQRPTTPYDAETTTSRTRSCRGIRSARAALVQPIRGRSSKTSTVPSTSPRMPDHSGRRMDLGASTLHQRGLAGTVRTEDHPALVLLDRPVDLVEQGGTAALDGDVGELEHGIRRMGPQRRVGVGGVARQPTAARPTDVAPARCVWTTARRLRRGLAVPVAAVLATCWTRAAPVTCGLDDLADAVVGDDPRHLVGGVGRRSRPRDVLALHGLLRPPAMRPVLAWRSRRPATRSGWEVPRVQRRGDRGRRGRRASVPDSGWCPLRSRGRCVARPTAPTAVP